MKAKVNKNKSYREKQRKAAAIKAGTYLTDVPDYVVEDFVNKFGMSQNEAIEIADDMLKIRTLAVQYGDHVCCHMCGRQNWSEYIGYEKQKREWTVENSLYLVAPNLQDRAARKNSMILCTACLKDAIKKQYNTDTFALCNDGTCMELLAGQQAMVMNFHDETGLSLWLKRKISRDFEIYNLDTKEDIITCLTQLMESHTLQVNGEVYGVDKCYALANKFLKDIGIHIGQK